MSDHFYTYPPSASGDDSVSGVYTTGGATEDLDEDPAFRAKVQEEERRIFAMYGIDSDFDDTYSSIRDGTNSSVKGNDIRVDYSEDAAEYSVDSAIDYSVNAADDSVVSLSSSIFARSYDGIMKTLAAFTPHKEHPDSPKRTEGTKSFDDSESKDKAKIHEDWYLDLETRSESAPPPNTIVVDPDKQASSSKRMSFKERAKKARWISLILPCLFIAVVVGVGGGVIAYTKKDDSDDSSPMPLSPTSPDDSPTQPFDNPNTSNETPSDASEPPVVSETPPEETPADSAGETETITEETPASSTGETEEVPEDTSTDFIGWTDMPSEETAAPPEKVNGCGDQVAVSCEAHFSQGCTMDGLYWISPRGEFDGIEPFQVFCDQTSTVSGIVGGWTLILNNHIDQQLTVEEPLVPATSGGLKNEHWVSLRGTMSTGMMVMDENGETAFITKGKLENANCWTPWDIPTLVPHPGDRFVGLAVGPDGVYQFFSLFRMENGSCNLVGEDVCALHVGGPNDSTGSGPFNYCDGGWDVFPSEDWSYQQRVLFYVR